VVAGLAIVVKGANTSRKHSVPITASDNTPAANANPSVTTPSTTTPGTAPPAGGVNELAKLNPKARNVLAAAVLGNATLNFAQLQHVRKMRQTLTSTVVPEKVDAYQKVYATMGRILATDPNVGWGYSSVREAQIRSGYYILTKRYKLDQLTKNRAVVSLYWFSHYRTKDDWDNNQEHNVYGLSIIMLRLVNGHWLFAGTKDPRPDQAPPAAVGLTTEEIDQQFQPYLGGFHAYSASG
jgi:hypothetical protein